jgi:heme/copper-type cytochrome/quinol oxidase subunit 2
MKPGALHPLGARVTLKVTSDVADEVHVHGYDRFADLKPKRTTTLSFKATSPGLYEVEAEDADTLLVQLLVR